MLKIKKLTIEIETKEKKFGRVIDFLTTGLTIIKGDNHSGKTTIASSIFYGLGMEELLGGKNIVALDSILTSKVPYNSLDLDVITSVVILEIENHLGKCIQLKRYIKHYDIEPRIIEITDDSGSESYFLHDPGAAISDFGFYNYLENFLGLSLPIVPKFEEGETKLYLQVIFNACFIEQIKGWTDFFAAIPNYGIKDAKKRIVEYILDLKTFDYEQQKNKYEDSKTEITQQWDTHINKIKTKTELINGVLKNLPENVRGTELLSKSKYDVMFSVDDKHYTLNEYLSTLGKRKDELDKTLIEPKNDIENKILTLKEKLANTFKSIESIKNSIASKDHELENLIKENTRLVNEIENITYLQKIEKYTNSDSNTNKIFKGECPTCSNPISSSLYKKIEVMGLEENKEYIKSQKDILVTYIKVLEHEIENEKKYYKQVLSEYEADKQIVEYLERDFITDAKSPSYALMKELVIIEDKIQSILTISKDLIALNNELKEIAKLWDSNEKLKMKYEMSLQDNEKLRLLESSFMILLKDFLYGSKREDQIWISKSGNSKYLPMIKIGEDAPQQIRYNSSASDFVRSIWAYLISLYEVSEIRHGKHLGIFLFDEPAQHAMTETSQSALFKKLSSLKCQSIVFASFENKTDANKEKFLEMTKSISKERLEVVTIEDRAIIELNT